MRQIGLGIQQYLQDYDETYPHVYYEGGSWQPYGTGAAPVIQTYPYIKSLQLWLCPSQPKTGNRTQVYKDGLTYTTQYSFNAYYFRTSSNGAVKVSLVGSPSLRIEVAEQNGPNCVIDGWSQILKGSADLRVATPHLEGMNALYGDGHVKWHPSSVIQADTDANAKNWGRTARYGGYDYN